MTDRVSRDPVEDHFFARFWPHYPKVLHVARYLVRHPQDAEDICMEVVERCLVKLRNEGVGSIQDPRCYLVRATYNLCKSHFRNRAKKPVPVSSMEAEERKRVFESLVDESADVRELQAREERLRVLHEALEALPEESRLLLLLRFEERVSYRELSKRFGRPEETMRSIICRARHRLQSDLRNRIECC